MNLIIDIGNTRAKLALFEGFDLIEKNIILEEELTLDYAILFFQKNKIENSILSASGKVEKSLLDFLQTKSNFILLSDETPIPITNAYSTPKTLGKDRLASAVAAHYFFPKENCLTIDCGTCTTYNFINEKGEFWGGNITPGLKMRLEAMHTLTAKLPLIELEKNEIDLVGKDTKTALQSGAQLGALYEMQGFIDAYVQRFGKIRTLLTGGNADFFVNRLKNQIFADSNLVLVGLNVILNYNFKQKQYVKI
jgi:type III pantothenate kinase